MPRAWHIPGARGDVAGVTDDELRLDEIPRQFERSGQPKAGVDHESRQDASLRLLPNATLSRYRLVNPIVLAQGQTHGQRRRQMRLDVEPTSDSLTELGGLQQSLGISRHDGCLVIEPEGIEISGPRSRIERLGASCSCCETPRRGDGVTRNGAPFNRALLQPEEDRGLLCHLFDLENVVTCG